MVPITFIVADTNSPPILGLKTSEKLNLIKRVMVVNEDIPEAVKEFSDCFGEMGTLPKVHHIHVDPDIKPVIHPPTEYQWPSMPNSKQNWIEWNLLVLLIE